MRALPWYFPRLFATAHIRDAPISRCYAPGSKSSIPRRLLIHPVANLSAQRDEILAALDFLFTGF